jgi:hypothetical protein
MRRDCARGGRLMTGSETCAVSQAQAVMVLRLLFAASGAKYKRRHGETATRGLAHVNEISTGQPWLFAAGIRDRRSRFIGVGRKCREGAGGRLRSAQWHFLCDQILLMAAQNLA